MPDDPEIWGPALLIIVSIALIVVALDGARRQKREAERDYENALDDYENRSHADMRAREKASREVT